ncbi:MAG TPA: sulfotransferase [Sphingomicrobium sp.]|nr:sulfotransferase [Sphingomicrobium sp.]
MDAETQALLERASALRQAGRVAEAIAAYRELLEREPALPESWYNLAWLQRRAGQYEDSLQSYAEALKRGVSGPEEVHLNRSVILSDHLARPDEARAELESALTLKPDYLPALLNLGNLEEDLGDREAAEKAYRRALGHAPRDGLALSRLAGVIEPQGEAADSLVGTLQSELSSGRPPGEQADLGFALGRLLDSRGDYAAAFAAYEAANRASRESFGPRFAGYDPAAQERFVERTIAAFSETPRTPDSDELPAPVFICGMFRSGSTLVERILAGHSAVSAGGELPMVPALASAIPGYPEAAAEADPKMLGHWRDHYRQGATPHARAGALLTDKRPDNFLHIGLIKRLFPGAKVIHTRRNRLDSLLSLYFLHLGPGMPYALDLPGCAHWYDQQERLIAHWKRLYPDDIFEVDYDRLVREPEAVISPMLAFLGLGQEEGLLNFHRCKGAVKTASVWQVREPLHARSSGRWRNYRKQLERALGAPISE